MSSTQDQYQSLNEPTGNDDYALRQGQKGGPIPVTKDSVEVEDPIDPATADSDETLAKDESDAMDQSNIIEGGRTRGAKPDGTYVEPGDEEGLGGPNDGQSRGA